MAVLIIERGRNKGVTIPLTDGRTLVIGRDKGSDLVVTNDPMASRRHCQIAARAGRVAIEDLGSSNGTIVNGRRIEPGREVTLELEDRVRVGQLVLALAPDAAEHHEGIYSGVVLGGYELGERIGRGAMGTVYRARQLSLERTVAVKLLARELTSDPRRVAMFTSEAKAAGRLNHPNIVSVFDVGCEEGVHYFSMEYMEQGSVEDAIQRDGPLSLERALRVALDAARGLAYAERQGLVHRDVKPANLMVNAEGTTKIGDLGIARTGLDAEEEGLVGSPHYMAPEQAKEEAVDHRADLYALGATLFHMLTGRVPFDGASARAVILKHLNEEPERVDAVNLEVPPELADLVQDLLQKAPEDRPQSAESVAERLEGLRLRYVEGATGSESALQDPVPGAAARRARYALGAALVLLVVAAAALALRPGPPPKPAPVPVDEAALAAEALEAKRAARVSAARAALEAAHGYVIENPSDLAGVRDRYVGVAEAFPDVPEVASAAAERGAQADQTLAQQAALARERAEREEQAQRAAEALGRRIDEAPPEALAAILQQSQEALARFGDTQARGALEGLRPRLEARVLALVTAEEEAARREIAEGRFAEARARAAAIESWRLDPPLRLRPIAQALAREAKAAEDRERARIAAERAKQKAEDQQRVRAADRAELRREVRHAEVWEELDRLRSQVVDAEAKAHLEERLFALEAVEAALARLRAHVNARPPREPRFGIKISKAYDGVAVEADERRVTFEAVQNAQITVGKTYASLGAETLAEFFERLKPASEERYGLAHLLYDLGAPALAREQLERVAAAEGAGALGERARRALRGELWGPE